jgi:uncharacterized protein YwgA
VGYISAGVFRRLYLLCLVAAFENGVYGALRLQKVSYAVERETAKKPFQFKHAPYGQYSEDLEDIKEQLISMGYISAIPLSASSKGNRYVLTEKAMKGRLNVLLESLDPGLKNKMLQVVREIGYLEEKELRRLLYSYEEFINSEMNDVLIESNLPDMLRAEGLSQDACEELELALNPNFVGAMSKIVQGLEESNIDWDKVKKVVPR